LQARDAIFAAAMEGSGMPGYVNEAYFNAEALGEACAGIVDPTEGRIDPRTILYRFSNVEEGAGEGNWWLDEMQYLAVKAWGDEHGIGLPLAARVCSATALRWNSFTMLTRASVCAPLKTYEGLPRPQTLKFTKDPKLVGEFLDPGASRTGAQKIKQLYVPGLRRNPSMVRAALICGAPERIEIDASQIFGTLGKPENYLAN
jgi:hypothetical protein